MLEAKQMFLKCFYDITILRHFHGSVNIVLILVPGNEFYSAKCAQFLLTFAE